ncbi:hypothetical protein DOT_3850 [Desulfosporosinus sp. OT]|nr:hypothetical protein DOT_3850 [Desulfosporosinus sp. OT]
MLPVQADAFFMKNTPSKSTERLIFFLYLRSLGLYNGLNYCLLHGNTPIRRKMLTGSHLFIFKSQLPYEFPDTSVISFSEWMNHVEF